SPPPHHAKTGRVGDPGAGLSSVAPPGWICYDFIHQVDTVAAHNIEFVRGNIRKRNPKATILETACRVSPCPIPSRDAACRWWKTVPRSLTKSLPPLLQAGNRCPAR